MSSLSEQFPWLEGATGLWEPMATMGTAMAAEIPAGLYGLTELARTGDPDLSAEAVEDILQRYTYLPRTPQGMEGLQNVGDFMQGLMESSGLDRGIAEYQTQVSRLLPPAAGAAMEGMLAVVPPARSKGVLNIADRANDQAKQIRKVYDTVEGPNMVARDYDELWWNYWDEADPGDISELEGLAWALEKGPPTSPHDRMVKAATIASAKEAGADIPPKTMDTAYRVLREDERYRGVMDSPLDPESLGRAQGQRSVDAMEAGYLQGRIESNPNQTFPERRGLQMDLEDQAAREGRLGSFTDQDYLESLGRLAIAPQARSGRLGGYVPPLPEKAADQPLLNLPDPRGLAGPEKSTIGKALKPLSLPAVRAREKMRAAGETIVDEAGRREGRLLVPEDLHGSVLVPVSGDRTRAGSRLLEVRGVPLRGALELEGGPGFSEQHAGTGAAWASMKGAAGSKQANITKAAEETGRIPYGVYTAMGPEGSNFSHHVAEGMLRQVPNIDISKTAKRDFDRFVREKAVPSQRIPEWVGIDSDEALDQILGRGDFPMEGSGEMRKRLVSAMGSAQFRDVGFPSYADTLEAVNDPRLAGEGVGASGLVVFEGDPGAPLIRETGHASYSHDIPGEYVGGLERSVPLEVMFPKTVGRLAEEGKTNIPRSFQMSHHYEVADDEWLENLLRYLENPY